MSRYSEAREIYDCADEALREFGEATEGELVRIENVKMWFEEIRNNAERLAHQLQEDKRDQDAKENGYVLTIDVTKLSDPKPRKMMFRPTEEKKGWQALQ